MINDFIASAGVISVIDFKCGDGGQLRLSRYPNDIGVDVSAAAIANSSQIFSHDKTKSFVAAASYAGEKADASISLDVIYHLIEDDVYEEYMKNLFGAASRYVIIYSSSFDGDDLGLARHVRHRKFTDWVNARCP